MICLRRTREFGSYKHSLNFALHTKFLPNREEKQRERDERQKERELKREELEAQERDKQRAHELALAQRQSEAGSAAPIKFTDILVGMVPGVTVPSINNFNVNASITSSNRTDVVNAVATRASKVKDDAEPAKLTASDFSFDNISKDDFSNAQSKCSLENIRAKVKSKAVVTVKSRSVQYEVVKGLIYCVCVKSKHDHEVGIKQLVVPRKFIPMILSTAHDSPVAGHFSQENGG